MLRFGGEQISHFFSRRSGAPEGIFAGQTADTLAGVDGTAPLESATAELDADRDVTLVKQLIATLSNGALEARESSRIYGQPTTGGIAPLEVVVLNKMLPGYGERILTTILVALERKADGSLPDGVMYPVTREKVQELLAALQHKLKEITG